MRQLAMIGIEPQVDVSTDSFQSLPFLVGGTNRVALIPASLAVTFSDVAGVRIMDAPYDAVPLQEAMWWHPSHTHDAVHAWLRDVAARAGAQIPESAAVAGFDARP